VWHSDGEFLRCVAETAVAVSLMWWWVGWLLLVSFLVLFVVFVDLGFSVQCGCEMTWAFVWKRFWEPG
jgi:hypothetical protein